MRKLSRTAERLIYTNIHSNVVYNRKKLEEKKNEKNTSASHLYRMLQRNFKVSLSPNELNSCPKLALALVG